MAFRITSSNLNGERMPSISVGLCQQPGHTMPLAWGLPQRGQTGGISLGSFPTHSGQRKPPPLPQPTQRRGKKESTASSTSLPERSTSPTKEYILGASGYEALH